MNVQEVTLDLTKLHAAKQTVYIGRGDRGGTTVRATVNEAGKALDMGGMAVSLTLPLGSVACEVDGCTATCVLGESLVPDGTEFAHLRITDGERAYSTERFRIVTLSGHKEE